MPVSLHVNKPKTHKGRQILESHAPKIIENDKKTLILKGGHTSELVNDFLNDLCALKQPLIERLKWRNPVLPFDDTSFIEKMCRKYDCSLFVVGLHSKKRPHNIVIGRLHDGELLDMFELGLSRYESMTKDGASIAGAKPILLISGEYFEERRNMLLKSLLLDLFRGPTLDTVRSVGVQHLIQIAMTAEDCVSLRVRSICFKPANQIPKTAETLQPDTQVLLRTPSGAPVCLDLQDTGPLVDFKLRRSTLPSEEKWKRAHRVPTETRKAQKINNKKVMDVFGSKVGRVHVGRKEVLDQLRPGASLRTALTGHRKRGFERRKSNKKDGVKTTASSERPAAKRARAV